MLLRIKASQLATNLYPLFEQVLVVAVGPGAQRQRASRSEPARVRVDPHRHQPVLLACELRHVIRHPVCCLLERIYQVLSSKYVEKTELTQDTSSS